MIPIAVSQRVDIHTSRGERRDALDQRLADFLAACGLLAVPMPNRPALAMELIGHVGARGILLSGGNDLIVLGGDAPERDETELRMLEWAAGRGLPVFGMCRGMQMIVHAFGGSLRQATGHVAVDHPVGGSLGERRVNSYHTWAIDVAPKPFAVTAMAPDGVIEAFAHPAQPIAGIMWHPERNAIFDAADLSLFRRFFGVDQ